MRWTATTLNGMVEREVAAHVAAESPPAAPSAHSRGRPWLGPRPATAIESGGGPVGGQKYPKPACRARPRRTRRRGRHRARRVGEQWDDLGVAPERVRQPWLRTNGRTGPAGAAARTCTKWIRGHRGGRGSGEPGERPPPAPASRSRPPNRRRARAGRRGRSERPPGRLGRVRQTSRAQPRAGGPRAPTGRSRGDGSGRGGASGMGLTVQAAPRYPRNVL